MVIDPFELFMEQGITPFFMIPVPDIRFNFFFSSNGISDVIASRENIPITSASIATGSPLGITIVISPSDVSISIV